MTSFILGGSVFAAILIGVGQSAPAIPATAPRVVATTPGSDARIAPGRLVISVTFDQPMRRNSYSFVETGQGRYPDCDRTPRQSADRRSFTLNCRIEPGQSYAIGFNGGRFRNFVGANGVPAEPSLLRFSS